jgi:DnaK suppressor protein
VGCCRPFCRLATREAYSFRILKRCNENESDGTEGISDYLEREARGSDASAHTAEGLRIERTPDALDETQFSAARELSTRNLERESSLLREVRAALDRIADGSYGTCLQCEEEVSRKRLKAMPWATLCIACQEVADRNGRHSKNEERLLRAA